MMNPRRMLLVLSCLFWTAFAVSPMIADMATYSSNQSYEPQPQDEQWVRGPAFIDASKITKRDEGTARFSVQLTGHLPTPCHQLRAVVSGPDDQRVIHIALHSVMDPERMCMQMLAPFDRSITIPDLPPGTYPVHVNGSLVGEVRFD